MGFGVAFVGLLVVALCFIVPPIPGGKKCFGAWPRRDRTVVALPIVTVTMAVADISAVSRN